MGAKYLLLGGTGAMGVYLHEELLKKGGEVYVTSRKSREGRGGLRYVVGDAHDVRFLKVLLEKIKPDAVVDFMVYSTTEFLDRYKILLQGTGHYLFLSTYRVFADSQLLVENSPRLLDVCEDFEYRKSDEYAMTKARQENILRDSVLKNWTILRPSITYSKSRFQFGCLEAGLVCFRALADVPVIMPTEMLGKHTTMTWAGDVARMIAGLVLSPQAMCEDFNVVTSESHTWREIAEIYRSSIGMKVKEVSLSDYLTICAKHQTLYDRMFDRVMDNEKVLRVSGLSKDDITPLAVGLGRELEAFKENPNFQYGIDLGGNGRMDRLCGTYISLSGFTIKQKMVYWRYRYKIVSNIAGYLTAIKHSV